MTRWRTESHQHFRHVTTALVFQLTEHVRNRMALLLIVLFVPLWITLIKMEISGIRLRFRLQATGEVVVVVDNHLLQLSGALSAATLITGFMMFTVTHRSGDFEQRLVMSGYPRAHLVLGKLGALVVIGAMLAVYLTAILHWYWQPRNLWLVAASLFSAALAYGGIGIMLGKLLKSELEGMFVIIMVSLVDIMLQNPVINTKPDFALLRLLPGYGPTQFGIAAAFRDGGPLNYLLAGPLWLSVTATLGLVFFRLRTRGSRAEDDSLH